MVATGGSFGKRAPVGGRQPATPRVAAPENRPDDTYAECPFCAEQVLARAKKCRHCGETIDAALRKAEEAMRSLDRPSTVYMNAGGGFMPFQQQLRPYNHGFHLIVSFFTAGFWLPFWLILYLMRDRTIYY